MKPLLWELHQLVAAPARRLATWARRRPRLATILGSLITVYALGWACVPAANAAGGGEPSPDAPADHLLTSAGVRASHYSALFINRGDFFSGDKGIWAWFIDILWGIYYWGVTTAIDTFTWLLGFTWVDVIAAPMRALSTVISQLIGHFGLVTFGLFLAGCLAAVLVTSGRFGKAFVEIGVTAVIFTGLTGFLANPVLWLTEPGGALETAREGGAQLSAAIIQGDGDLNAVSSGENPVGDGVIGPMLDIFLVTTAETASFGHPISGDCGVVVDTAVKNLDPIKRDTNSVRDAVGTCDADAKTYADNTGLFQLMSIWSMGAGSCWLFLFAWAIAIILVGAILGALFMGLTTLWRGVFALFPWGSRDKLLFSVALIFAGLFFVITFQVALAGWLWLITSALPALAELGVPIGMQLNLLGWIGTAAVVSLLIFLYHHHRTAKRLAEKMNGALENAGTKRDMMPVMTLPTGIKRIAQHHLGNTGLRRQLGTMGDSFGDSYDDNRMINFIQFGQGPVTGSRMPVDGGQYVATPAGNGTPRPSGGGGGGSLALGAAKQLAAQSGSAAAGAAAKGASAVGTAVRYAGALKAGVAGVALQAGQDVAGAALRRRIVVDGKGTGRVDHGGMNTRKGISSDPAVMPPQGPRIVSGETGPENPSGRKISIGQDGIGKVIHDTTAVQQPPKAAPTTSTAIERVRPRALRS